MTKKTLQKTRSVAVCQVERKLWIRKQISHRPLWILKYEKVENRTRALDCCIIDAQIVAIRRK